MMIVLQCIGILCQNAVTVDWSKRMTVCAGLCAYEGDQGLCSIRLSQPLLQFRSRRDLVQTLLHGILLSLFSFICSALLSHSW
jgi:hypothetical protein